MAVHLTGGDLARVYAAGVGHDGPAGGRFAVRNFIDTLRELTGREVHIGDPDLWDQFGGGKPCGPLPAGDGEDEFGGTLRRRSAETIHGAPSNLTEHSG